MKKLCSFAVALAAAAPALCAAQSIYWKQSLPVNDKGTYAESSGTSYQQICDESAPFVTCNAPADPSMVTYRFFSELKSSGNGLDQTLTKPTRDDIGDGLNVTLLGDPNDTRQYEVTIRARYRGGFQLQRGFGAGAWDKVDTTISTYWNSQESKLTGTVTSYDDDASHEGSLSTSGTNPSDVVVLDGFHINDTVHLVPTIVITEHADIGLNTSFAAVDMGAYNADNGLFVTVQAAAIPAVPEPAGYAFLLAGLPFLGWLKGARRT